MPRSAPRFTPQPPSLVFPFFNHNIFPPFRLSTSIGIELTDIESQYYLCRVAWSRCCLAWLLFVFIGPPCSITIITMSFLNWNNSCKQVFAFRNPRKSFRFGETSLIYQQPRRFLDLPTEIRLLIYEAIFTPASVVLQSGELPAMIAVLRNFPELISRGSRDVQLLRTCRTCYEEATPIFYASLNLLVYQHLPLLRMNFLPGIGPLNASFIKTVIITPIGLPGEHQRLLECLGPKHGGLIGAEHLTLEIWNSDHVAAFISTCQELMQHHQKLKILFGRGTDADFQIQAGDIPARLKLAKTGQNPGHRVSSQPLC
jgi:hypothetical protein